MLQKTINILGYNNYCRCGDINEGIEDLSSRYKTLHQWQSRTRISLRQYLKNNFDLSAPGEYQLNSLMFYLIGIYLEYKYPNSASTEIKFEKRYTLIVNNLLKSEFEVKYQKAICSTADMSFFLSFFKEDSSLSLKTFYPLNSQQRKALTNLISNEITDSKVTFKKLISIFFKKN